MSVVLDHKIVRCCVKCNECGDCYTHTIYDIRDLIKAIHIEVANYGASFVSIIYNGYGCTNITRAALDKLLFYKETIIRYYDSLRTKTISCLCDSEFQRIKEKVGNIIDLIRCERSSETDIRYDNSQYNKWVAENPYCVSYDAWEKGMVACNQPTFLISSTKEQPVYRTLFAIASKDPSGCVVKLLAFANKAKCENKVVASATNTSKCKTELQALVTKYKCDMSLALYSTLLKCNLSFNVISTVLGCGARFTVDGSGEPMVRIGAKSSRLDALVKLAGGTWENMNETEFNQIYVDTCA